MSTTLKNKIVNELKSISWDTSESEPNEDKATTAIVTAIRDYLLTEHNITALTNGSYFNPPSAPTPVIAESLVPNLITTSHDIDRFKKLWNNVVKSGLPENGIQRMFRAIDLYLKTPTLNVAMNVTPVTITALVPPHPIPQAPVVFPTMVLQGKTAESEILHTTFSNVGSDALSTFWTIMSRHIHVALSANIIPPIPTAGFVGAFPYTGVTNVTLTFN